MLFIQGATLVLADWVFQVFLIEIHMESRLTIVRSMNTSVFHITKPLRSLLTSKWSQNSQFSRAVKKLEKLKYFLSRGREACPIMDEVGPIWDL